MCNRGYVTHENVSSHRLEVEKEAVGDVSHNKLCGEGLHDGRNIHQEETKGDLDDDGRNTRIVLHLCWPAANNNHTKLISAGLQQTIITPN